MTFKTEWKPVPHELLEDLYLVSNTGQIKSVKTGKLIKASPHKKGYRLFSTKVGGRTGKYVCVRIPRMVALAFIPNPDSKPQVNHIDGNKKNDFVTNLEWTTGGENVRHAYDIGLASNEKGVASGKTALTKEQVGYVISVYKPKHRLYGARALGRKFNVPHSTIIKSLEYLS
jgi:hypothetical protein